MPYLRNAFLLAACAALVTVPTTVNAQVGNKPLTLERVYASPSLTGSTPRSLELSPDGRLVTLLKPRPDDLERLDLWAIDPQTGQSRMLVDSKKFESGAVLSEAERMQRERARIANLKGIVRYSWSSDGKSILVPLDGDIFLADLNGNVRRLTNSKETELDATVSEKGRYVSYVLNNELNVLDLGTGKSAQITKGASDTVSWGLAEFIAQEELGRTKGHWWSPDDSRIAVARVDESGVELATRAAIGAEKTTVVEQRYPRAGTSNAVVDLYLMNPDGSGAVKADLGDDPDYYLARVSWTHDGRSVIVKRLSRDQHRLDYLVVDPRTGKSRILLTDKADNWINLGNDFYALKDGSFLLTSERSGYNHIYRLANGKLSQLTSGPWEVGQVKKEGLSDARGILAVNEELGRLIFSANKGRAIDSHLYALDYARKGAQPIQLTLDGTSNGGKFDRSGRLGLISTNYPGQPTQLWLSNDKGKRLAWIAENKVTGDHPLAPYIGAFVAPQYGQLIAADGKTKLDYRMLSPKLAPGQKAPVYFKVYGGPQSRDVSFGFVSPIDQYLVQQGWIVFQASNRGQEGRGTAFQTPAYHKLGGVEVADQLAALAWLKKQPGVDPARVAVHGHSYGGYMTLKLLEAAPGAFAAGISAAPVTRWELYDTHYTEKYMGDPRKEPAAYAKASALTDSVKIRDPLMVIHGMSDDNVLFQNSTELFAKLQEAKVPFETMVYPGLGHSISGTNISVHQWTTILNFLKRNGVAPGAR
ncbi:S9 family peptidase [Sphingomonas rhizophila]|uniref:S9 family peptidase n=1 Tax=Sphingomonas rhizophila TaxID=2071607 RepID=UPI001FE2BA54|nr:DPP IV N-terminal domain-containing protein [Sphingomonas rhizophila]